jgi:ubiquinone/menaquinone biosynthesis C-methylase UbiE
MSEGGELFPDGEAYERLMGRWSRLVGEAFLDWLDVPKRLRWIDVGCGSGAFTDLLITRCAPVAVAAIDPSNGQLAYARARPGIELAQFQQGDAQQLPFSDSTYDVAVMALVISFISDPLKAVAEMARVVRPGGWIAAYMWDRPGGGAPVEPIYAAARSLGMDPPPPPGVEISRTHAMQDLWEKARLTSIETRVIRVPVVYANFDDFWDSNIVPVGPQGKFLQETSQGAREQLRDRLREQLPVCPDGRIAYEAFANAVKGRRELPAVR